MNKAQAQAVWISKEILSTLTVRAGQTEKQVADLIKAELSRYGAKPAFRTIVASGKRSAIPHGYATSKKIRDGELVVVDFGARYNGWCSDVTRTFIVGRRGRRQEKILKVVRRAQIRAIGGVKAGARCSAVDALARDHITKLGFGKNFIHSTGHGIGTKVHETPKISKRNRRILRDGDVISIEPGIYIKGFGGARWEDMVQVTRKGCKVLTK